MSINVTVSGNPVRINRGRMVTGYDPDKIEFDKRRFMRLEQVRQQSKEIAESLRNKLKKEKEKCLSEIEKDGEAKLRNWQTKKLLELQDQYKEALDEIGVGYKDACEVEQEEEILLEKQENNKKIAKTRGKFAADRLQIEKNEENLKKAVPIQRKKFTREIENERAKKVKQSKKKLLYDEDMENLVPDLEGLTERSDLSIQKEQQVSKEQQTSPIDTVPKEDKAAQTILQEPKAPIMDQPSMLLQRDTRISDRIRRRTIRDPEMQCSYFQEMEKIPESKQEPCVCCKCPASIKEPQATDEKVEIKPVKEVRTQITQTSNLLLVDPEKSDFKESETMEGTKSKLSTIAEKGSVNVAKGKKSNEFVKGKKSETKSLPTKPKVTLKSTIERPSTVSGENVRPVEFYDHSNRYSKSYLPNTSSVEKIGDDDIVISPNIATDEDIREKIRQRQNEAKLRGELALEKEKIRREYEELLRKLPALQKQERILEIGRDKEKYHMSEDRLKELERKRQNRLDNAYEEIFARPAVVTLPKRKQKETIRYDSNVGEWDVDNATSSYTRTEELSRLLSGLKSQKSDLLKEIETTMSHKSKSIDHDRIPTKRKREEPKKVAAPTPRKKQRLKVKSLVRQNVSTQTTPKSECSAATSPIRTEPSPPESKSTENEAVCVCDSKKGEETCEIVIRIKEDQKPEIKVNPPFSGSSVKVVAEDVTLDSSKKSWGANLTTGSHTTTSTSYMDPPKTAKIPKKKKKRSPNMEKVSEKSKSLNSTDSSTERKLDPRLLTYIKKLLNMSRASIDDLTVSAASDVSTPTHSVVETPSNNPLHRLINVMKYFNIDGAELQKQLSYASDDTSKHYNTSESVTITPSTSDVDKLTDQYKSCTEFESKNKKDEDLMKHYADIAASCSKKIINLTAMIEKVREEKKKILESTSSSSDKDMTATTSYKDLPDKKDVDDVDRFLKIDYEFAEELKKQHKRKDEISDELEKRLQSLRNSTTVTTTSKKQVTQEGNQTPVTMSFQTRTVEQTKGGKTVGFVTDTTTVATKPTEQKPTEQSFFLDIPKLPRLEAPSLDLKDKKKKKPPPTKALKTVEMHVPPHELSTIVEADSQLSVKSDEDKMETMLTSIGMEWAIPTLKKTREALELGAGSSSSGGDLSLKEFLSKISSNSEDGSMSLTESKSGGMSVIVLDNRRTSTPIDQGEKLKKPESGSSGGGGGIFSTDSDLSSVREQSGEKFYDLTEGSKTR